MKFRIKNENRENIDNKPDNYNLKNKNQSAYSDTRVKLKRNKNIIK